MDIIIPTDWPEQKLKCTNHIKQVIYASAKTDLKVRMFRNDTVQYKPAKFKLHVWEGPSLKGPLTLTNN